MRDNYGDKIGVRRNMNDVWIEFLVDGKQVDMYLRPKKARKFIRKIQQVTSEIEIDLEGVIPRD